MGAGKNQLRFPLMAVNGIVTETLDNCHTCRNVGRELQKHGDLWASVP